MTKISSTIVACVLALVCATSAFAQQPRPRTSPHETVSAVVDGTGMAAQRVIIVYGRPYSKAPNSAEIRKIWGGLVPFGQVWRFGADEATLLISPVALDIGGATVPAGVHTLFLLPNADGSAKLIINKQIGQWGLAYSEAQDLARVDMKKEDVAEQVDQFTIGIQRTQGQPAGTINATWEKVRYSVPFTVKK